jgi:hypothetical protein
MISCLSEEVEKFYQENPTLTEAIVKFVIDENEEIIYSGVVKESLNDGWIYIKTVKENEQNNIVKILTEQAKTLQSIHDTSKSQTERKIFAEQLEKLSQETKKLEGEIREHLISVKNNIEDKKNRLLDKLLQN